MKLLYGLNKAVLFACVSMYFGTGWSMILFSFPTALKLTTENYYEHFVPQIAAATTFLTYMTMVMLANCIIFIIEERRSRRIFYPIGMLVLVIAATLLTTVFIFPYNNMMAAGISGQAELQEILHKWMQLHNIRVSLWTLEWLVMMAYFSFRYCAENKGDSSEENP